MNSVGCVYTKASARMRGHARAHVWTCTQACAHIHSCTHVHTDNNNKEDIINLEEKTRKEFGFIWTAGLKNRGNLATLSLEPFFLWKHAFPGSCGLCECIQSASTGLRGAVISRRGWDPLSRDKLPHWYSGVPFSDCYIQEVPMSLSFFSTVASQGCPIKFNRVDGAGFLLLWKHQFSSKARLFSLRAIVSILPSAILPLPFNPGYFYFYFFYLKSFFFCVHSAPSVAFS